eukprot:gene15019-16729_t
MSTVAGSKVFGYVDNVLAVNGSPAAAASLNNPKGIAMDTLGGIYFTDANQRVRFIDGTTNIITTVFGATGSTFSTENSTATSTKFSMLYGIYVETTCANSLNLGTTNSVAIGTSGAIYFGDNARVRQLVATTNASCWSHKVVLGTSKTGGLLSDLTVPMWAFSDIAAISGVWVNSNESIFIAEPALSRIRYSFDISTPT